LHTVFNNSRTRPENTILINANNGVLQIDYADKKVTLLGKHPKYMFNYCIYAKYKPGIHNDVIHEMLVEILGEEQTDLIYQIAAMAIRDANPKLAPSKIAYLFIGPRNTGKNTVMNLLHKFFGKAIVSHITLNDIAKNKFIKSLLEGKVINLDDELPESLLVLESREIKSLTGGKFHNIEPKHGKPYTGTITAILVFAGNQFPRCSISKEDSAFWDRWEVIHFDHPGFKVDEGHNNRLFTPANLSGFFIG
jgi:phage/plasmid-associated DNA primase